MSALPCAPGGHHEGALSSWRLHLTKKQITSKLDHCAIDSLLACFFFVWTSSYAYFSLKIVFRTIILFFRVALMNIINSRTHFEPDLSYSSLSTSSETHYFLTQREIRNRLSSSLLKLRIKKQNFCSGNVVFSQ